MAPTIRQGGSADEQPPEADVKKPAAFARVWSAADEVRILEALAAHSALHRAPPKRSQLCDVLSGRALDKAEFTVTEIYEKVRRLRNRYLNQRSAGGVAPGGGDGDEVRKYELSKAIWGQETVPGLPQPKVAKKEGSTSPDAAPDKRVRRGYEELRSLYPNLAVAVERIVSGKNRDLQGAVLKRAFEFIDDDEAAEFDAKVKKQRVLEAKVMTSRTTLRSMVLDMLINSMD